MKKDRAAGSTRRRAAVNVIDFASARAAKARRERKSFNKDAIAAVKEALNASDAGAFYAVVVSKDCGTVTICEPGEFNRLDIARLLRDALRQELLLSSGEDDEEISEETASDDSE